MPKNKVSETERNHIPDAVKPMIENLPVLLASLPLIAKYYKEKFDALVHVGFTEEQALRIICVRGLNDFPGGMSEWL